MFSPLTDPLVATFNKMRASTCRKYVAKQAIVMSNSLSQSSVFTLENYSKNLSFLSIFVSKTTLCLLSVERIHSLLNNM